MRTAHPIGGLLLTVMLLAAPVAALGQEAADADAARTYGTAEAVSHTIPAMSFHGFTAGATYDRTLAFTKFCTGVTTCTLQAGALLPAGALITAFELEACDTSIVGQLNGQLYRVTKASGSANAAQLATVNTSVAGAPGCISTTQDLVTPHVVDNAANSYIVHVFLTSSQPLSNALSLQAVRIFYRLQVSSAPGVATFNDVPTNHPFFPFVEALVASGITSGCNVAPPLYCPDNLVTRGQLAKFLGQALGLHWAP